MPNDEFTPGDATDVAHKCIIATTLNNHPLRPNETLAQYGVSTGEQILLIKTRIRTNSDFGLPRHGRSIDPNALKDVDTDTTIADLSGIVFDESFDLPSALPFAASEVELSSRASTGSPARAGAMSNAANNVVEFTRRNPVQALMISAAMGMLMGLMIGTLRR
ncbi:MAG: hypothetical protein H7Y30_13840 [Pyrinomonadaceae bacterium]|nr:hypothetical protein [Pyrinomonadaceae bacterium]